MTDELVDLANSYSEEDEPARRDWDVFALPPMLEIAALREAELVVLLLTNMGFEVPACWYVHWPSMVSAILAIGQAFEQTKSEADQHISLLLNIARLREQSPWSDIAAHMAQMHSLEDGTRGPIPSFEDWVATLAHKSTDGSTVTEEVNPPETTP